MAMTMPSPTSIGNSPFSFYNDSASSPTSSKGSRGMDVAPQRTSNTSSLGAPASPYPQTVEPSPVDSNGTAGTDTTEIDEAPQDHDNSKATHSPRAMTASPKSPSSQLGKLDTALAGSPAPDDETNPQSVIHAPEQFKHFSGSAATPSMKVGSTTSPSDRSGYTILSPNLPKENNLTPSRRESATSPLKTDLPTPQIADRSTPHAQTIQEAEEEWTRQRRHSANLAGIPETHDPELPDTGQADSTAAQVTSPADREHEQQIAELRTALSECWTLCNTLANLSSTHRTRVFAHRGQPEVQEQAWRACWRLCQNLYENRAEDHVGLLLPTLEMCRDFCQALFDARLKGDEVSDSVLRVSFELNNHLYNTHDRNLPSAFQERTLDFYLTLCHRLMKQRTSLPPEIDALLRACWTLAETLFSIRQNARDRSPDTRTEEVELLGSAVDACFGLCDLFKEGWTQARPVTTTERGTPRAPHQAMSSFSPTGHSIRSNSLFSAQSSPSVTRSTSSHSYAPMNGEPKPMPPETPTTIFDDMNESPMGDDGNHIPNILVLGPEQAGARAYHGRWTDSASTLSGYTGSSQRTSSTATAPGQSSATAANLTRIRILLLRAAHTAGFRLRAGSQGSAVSPGTTTSTITSPKTLSQQNDALLVFVKALPASAFGTAPWQKGIVENYKKFVIAWPAIIRSSVSSRAIMKGDGTPLKVSKNSSGVDEMVRVANSVITTGSAQTRTNAGEIAGAVRWMCRKESNNWLVDLHRAVFGGGVEEGIGGAGGIVG